MMGWHTQPDGLRWRRTGAGWRVRIDVIAHRLSDRRLLPTRLQVVACRIRGNHGFRYEFPNRQIGHPSRPG